MEEKRVILVASDEAAKGLQPADRPLDDPAVLKSPQHSTVLGGRPLPTATMRARMVQYLKVENAILRGKLPKVVQVTPRERARLVKYGKLVGDKIKELIQIVTPRTFARWVNGETGRKEPAKKGRPRLQSTFVS